MSSVEQSYFKDIRSLLLRKGERYDWPLKAEFLGEVIIRVSTDTKVRTSIIGPHVESVEVYGDRTFTFRAQPGTEFLISIINEQTGIFGKNANVTLEVEMRGPKKAIEVMDKIRNYVHMLLEAPDLYLMVQDDVKETLKQVAEVWSSLGDNSKTVIKDLMNIVKKIEEK